METIFVYAGGKFIAADPYEMANCDWEEDVFQAKGFLISQTVGDPSGLSYVLYHRDDYEAFLVLFQTEETGCLISVADWPDLISLLHQLSIIAIAARERIDRG